MNCGGSVCPSLCISLFFTTQRSLVTFSTNRLQCRLSKPTRLLGRRNINPELTLVANKNVGRTVRKPVNVYLPGDKIPSPKDPKNVRVVRDDRIQQEPETLDVFKQVMLEATKSVRERKFIVCEGARLVEEAFKANTKIHKLFVEKKLKQVPERLKRYVEEQNIPIHYVSQNTIKNWSSLTTPPGIVGVFLKPRVGDIMGKLDELQTGMPVTVICDNLREPGNLGSILRSAAGAGCKRVLLSKGCCDPWDEKVLRAGCGAQFRLPITSNYPLYSLADCVQIENSGYDEENDSKADCGEKSNGNSSCIGNKEVIDDFKVENGNPGEMSSSSSASEVKESYPNSFALFLADSNDDTETDERGTLPVVSYTDVDYTAFHNVYLVVGGETEGLSRDILQITSKLPTLHSQLVRATVARLRIPLYNQIDSLNASTAFAVIAYEMLRQHRLKQTPQRP